MQRPLTVRRSAERTGLSTPPLRWRPTGTGGRPLCSPPPAAPAGRRRRATGQSRNRRRLLRRRRRPLPPPSGASDASRARGEGRGPSTRRSQSTWTTGKRARRWRDADRRGDRPRDPTAFRRTPTDPATRPSTAPSSASPDGGWAEDADEREEDVGAEDTPDDSPLSSDVSSKVNCTRLSTGDRWTGDVGKGRRPLLTTASTCCRCQNRHTEGRERQRACGRRWEQSTESEERVSGAAGDPLVVEEVHEAVEVANGRRHCRTRPDVVAEADTDRRRHSDEGGRRSGGTRQERGGRRWDRESVG